jgi:hypothetical protein
MGMREDFRVIDASHAVYQRLAAEVRLLRIELALARGQWVPLGDKWEGQTILDRYPEMAAQYGIRHRRKL